MLWEEKKSRFSGKCFWSMCKYFLMCVRADLHCPVSSRRRNGRRKQQTRWQRPWKCCRMLWPCLGTASSSAAYDAVHCSVIKQDGILSCCKKGKKEESKAAGQTDGLDFVRVLSHLQRTVTRRLIAQTKPLWNHLMASPHCPSCASFSN